MNYYILLKNIFEKFDIKYSSLFFKVIFLSFFTSIIELLGIGNLIILISSISSEEYYLKILEQIANLSLISESLIIKIFTINKIILYCFIFYFLRFLIFIFNEYVIIKNVGQIKNKLSLSILKKNVYGDFEQFILSEGKSNLIRNIYIEADRVIDISIKFIRLISEIVLMLFIIMGLTLINLNQMGILIISFVLLFLTHSFFLKNFFINLGRQRSFYEKKVFNSIQNVMMGFKEIRVNNLSERFIRIFGKYYNNLTRKVIKVFFFSALVRPVIEITFIFGILLFLYYLFNFSSNPVTEMIFLALVLLRLYPSFNKIITFKTSIYVPTSAIDFLDKISQIKPDESIMKNHNKDFQFKDKICLKNISYIYPKTTNKILDNINLEIKKNSIFLIHGDSGAGKTTLINILMGLLKPSSGKILIDDKKLINGIGDWNLQVSYVSQDFFIFDTTLQNNITIFQEDNLNKYLYKKALKLSMSENLEKRFLDYSESSEGLDKYFSGGEKQRISLARALYFDKPILILDEPTSMLDEKNRDKILSNITELKKDKTIILISHDSAFRKIADDELNLKKI